MWLEVCGGSRFRQRFVMECVGEVLLECVGAEHLWVWNAVNW